MQPRRGNDAAAAVADPPLPKADARRKPGVGGTMNGGRAYQLPAPGMCFFAARRRISRFSHSTITEKPMAK